MEDSYGCDTYNFGNDPNANGMDSCYQTFDNGYDCYE
jgi:hypothetical protein